MAQTTVASIYVGVTANGEVVVDMDPDTLGARYDETIGGEAPSAMRVFELELTLPLPEPTKLTATVPDKGEEVVEITIT